MKKFFCIGILIFFIHLAYGQDSSVSCCVYLNRINGINVFATKKLDSITSKKIKEKKVKENVVDDFPYVYFLNLDGTEYLKAYASPGNWYNQFFEIGKVSNSLKQNRSLGIFPYRTFYGNDSLQIGMSIQKVLAIIPLYQFRVFSHEGIIYYTKETGLYLGENPSSPKTVEFLKFKNDKLISFGFGYGFPFFNPVFPP